MATTEVPETVVCPNCNHNVVIKLYQVDISINSSQGHFHTVHHRREPAYTVYCINCGHFITNDPAGWWANASFNTSICTPNCCPPEGMKRLTALAERNAWMALNVSGSPKSPQI